MSNLTQIIQLQRENYKNNTLFNVYNMNSILCRDVLKIICEYINKCESELFCDYIDSQDNFYISNGYCNNMTSFNEIFPKWFRDGIDDYKIYEREITKFPTEYKFYTRFMNRMIGVRVYINVHFKSFKELERWVDSGSRVGVDIFSVNLYDLVGIK